MSNKSKSKLVLLTGFRGGGWRIYLTVGGKRRVLRGNGWDSLNSALVSVFPLVGVGGFSFMRTGVFNVF